MSSDRLHLAFALLVLSSLPLCWGCDDGTSQRVDASMSADLSVAFDLAEPKPDLAHGTDGGAQDLAGGDAAVDAAALLAARPYTITVPSGYSAAVPTPLVLMIHGYNSDAAMHEAWLQLAPVAQAAGFLYVRADGTRDIAFKRGWNATDACCFFQPNPPDDLTYLRVVLDDVVAKYNVDPKRVFVIGHSNGGFMTNRLACELSSRIAAVVSIAGHNWKMAASCPASSPVAYLHIHANNDPTISYDGGKIFFLAAEYPAARDTVATWAAKDGCTVPLASTGTTIDLVSTAAGAETTVEAYGGCAAGTAVELWTMTGIAAADSPHQPSMNPGLSERLWTFLAAHPKP